VVAFLAGATRTGPSDKISKPVRAKSEPKSQEDSEVQEEQIVEEEVDEFSFVPAEEKPGMASETVDTTQALVEAVEVIEMPEEEDASPSGRLASMRDELTSDGPSPEGRQDRLRKFFGNE